VAALLHNVIIVHPRFTIVGGKFIMHYNATLCKEALGKKIAHGVFVCFF
jgi:acyl dehydratase